MRAITFIVPAACLALLALGVTAPSVAQDAKLARVKITAVKASGKAAKDFKPAIPPDLASLKDLLGKLGYDRYQYLMAPESSGAARAPFGFKRLPEGHAASVTWREHDGPGDDLLVDVSIDKAADAPEKPRVKVASMRVRLKSGASFLAKCPGAYADGDLLLIVTATRAD